MEKLSKIFKDNNIELFIDEPLKKHTNYKVGGRADMLLYPKSVEELKLILSEVDRTPYQLTILGRGSNLLISDHGIRGIVIKLDNLNAVKKIDDVTYELESGVSMVSVSVDFAKKGLTGMEFASGIPGNVGGSIYMNAGAHGSDMQKVLIEVTSITKHGEIIVRSKEQLDFKYR